MMVLVMLAGPLSVVEYNELIPLWLPSLILQLLSGMCPECPSLMAPPTQRIAFKLLSMRLPTFPFLAHAIIPALLYVIPAHHASRKPRVSQFPKGQLHSFVSWRILLILWTSAQKLSFTLTPCSYIPFPNLCIYLFLIQPALPA